MESGPGNRQCDVRRLPEICGDGRGHQRDSGESEEARGLGEIEFYDKHAGIGEGREDADDGDDEDGLGEKKRRGGDDGDDGERRREMGRGKGRLTSCCMFWFGSCCICSFRDEGAGRV